MTPRSLPLVERILASLARSEAPVPGEALAREFLGIHWIDRQTADRLLEPTLGADPRFEHRLSGWTLRAGRHAARPGNEPLDAAGCVVYAPRVPEAVATSPFGEGSPRLLVALGGAGECERARARGADLPGGAVIDLGKVLRLACQLTGTTDDPVRTAEALMLPHIEEDTAAGRARVIETIWRHVSAGLRGEGILTRSGLEELLAARLEEADLSGRGFGAAELAALEDRPGTYVFEDEKHRALYVGQSSCLRSRVLSYFCGAPRDDKDRAIRREAFHLVTSEEDTALDARIAESALIARRRPGLNTQRAVHVDPPEDGILLLRGPERLVAFVVRDGTLAGRFATRGGAGRVRRMAALAVAALADGPRHAPGAPARRAAGLVGAWVRARSGAMWLTQTVSGPPPSIEKAIVAAAREADLPANGASPSPIRESSGSARDRRSPRD